MLKNRKYVVMLTVALLMLGTLTAALTWGAGFRPVLAASGDLQAHKSVSSQEVPPGQTVRYTIVVTNTTSSPLSGLTVADALDPLLSVVQVDTLGWVVDTTTSGYITFTNSSLAANAVVTASFGVALDSGAVGDTVVDNVATFSAVGVDASTTNNVSFTVSSTPDLQIFAPENGAVVTTSPGQNVVISGKAWTEFDPPPFPEPPVLAPIENTDEDGQYYVVWTSVSGAQNYLLQQSDEPGFGSRLQMILDAAKTSELISVASPGTYYYRIASVAMDPVTHDERRSRWSDVESVVVTSVGAASLQTADLAWGGPTIQPFVANAAIEVQVSVDNGSTWDTAVLSETLDWWEWSYDWAVPEGDNIQQGLQARANYVSVDKYETDTITVTLDNSKFLVYMPIIFKYWPPIPYAPTLNDVQITDGDNDLRVSWTYSDGSASIPDPTEYQLQEATDASFTQSVVDYPTNNAYKVFVDHPGGTYYYRVRGKNTYGYGSWSAVKSISLANTSYYFDDGTEGWEITRSDEATDSDQLRDPVERNGLLYHLIFGSWDFSILSPMEEAPSVPYTIEAKVDIIDSESVGDGDYTAKSGQGYGIIFGGNGGSPCPADRYDAGGCLDHYYRLLVVYDQGNGSLKWSLKRIEGHESDGTARGTSLVGWRTVSGVSYSPTGWNTWRIEVEADNDIKIYLNDHRLKTVNDDDFINDPYFGVLLESTEFGEVGAKWDYFTVEPSN